VAQQVLSKQAAVTLYGHSQGALVLSRALDQISQELAQDGKDERAIQDKLSPLQVETLGGASATFPTGPQYTHRYNSYDMVPLFTGRPLFSKLKTYPGEKFDRFSVLRPAGELPPWKNGVWNRLARLVDATTHGARDVYVDRIP
jgi:hypothetical protein